MFLTKGKKQKLVVQALKNVGAMVAEGVPLLDALEHVARSTSAVLPRRRLDALEKILPSPAVFLEKVLMRLRQDISEGSTFSEAIARQAVVPGVMTDAIAQGEADGILPKALMKLDGVGMGDRCGETDAPIVKLVNFVLKIPVKLSAEAIAFPSLPEGQVLMPVESPEKGDASSSTATGDSNPFMDDFDAHVSEALDTIMVHSDIDLPNWRIYCRLRGKWAIIVGFPGMLMGPFTRRLLVMANIPYWSKEPQEGAFRLRTGKEMREFRIEYSPAAKQVYIELLPAP